MSTDFKDRLNKNIPEFLRAYPNLVSYLDAVGEYMNETKGYIDSFEDSHNSYDASKYQLNQANRSLGFEIPPNISERVSRTVLRDAIQAFIRKGTTDSLIWVLKVIGVEPVIRQAWLPSPEQVRKGTYIDPETGTETRYDINGFTYTDFLYGQAYEDVNGTYFKGFKYQDVFEENELEGIPIIGEPYKQQPDYITPVEKMPYVVIRIKNQSFNVATSPYEDEDGNQYEYGVTEEYEAVENLIQYFLYDTVRPANVKIIIVSSIQELDDEVIVDDTYTDNHEHGNTDEDEPVGIEETLDDAMEMTIQEFVVGDPILIGQPSPYTSQYQTINVDTIGATNQTYQITHYEDFTPFTVDTYISSTGGQSFKIPVRATLEFDLTAPSDTSLEVYGLTDFYDETTNSLITTVNSNNTETITVGEEYHGVYFVSPTSTEFEFSQTLNYN